MDATLAGVPVDAIGVAFLGGFILAVGYRILGLSNANDRTHAVKNGLARAALIWVLYPFAQTFLRYQHTDSLHEMWVVSIIYFTVVIGFVVSTLIHVRRFENGD
jgi:hypothetical protein